MCVFLILATATHTDLNPQFVSLETVTSLGFNTVRAARGTFYKRAKMLHDLDAEVLSYWISQSALLLTYWTPPSDPRGRRPQTSWMVIAIEHARNSGAHRYESQLAHHRTTSKDTAKSRNLCKRLWWCCVIRDRIMPLGLRRNIHITHANFNFDTATPLSLPDLEGEINHSSVHDAMTKRALARILSRVVELCIILTDVLGMIYYIDDVEAVRKGNWAEDMDKMLRMKTALASWFSATEAHIPPANRPRSRPDIAADVRGSVVLYTQTMYLYY
jgi:hypothetical protein